MQIGAFAGVRLDIGGFPTKHNYGLALGQNHFERILAAWVGELEVPIIRERGVTGFDQDDDGSFRFWARSRPRRPFSSDPTVMSPGWATARTPACSGR